MTPKEAYDKIDHTICINFNQQKIGFGLDTYEHCDCNDIDEAVDCLETIKQAIDMQQGDDQLCNDLICALTHDIYTCDTCNMCEGHNSVDIRLNLIKRICERLNHTYPFIVDNNHNQGPNSLSHCEAEND